MSLKSSQGMDLSKMLTYGIYTAALLFYLSFGISQATTASEDVDFIGEPDMYDWSKHPCRRKCQNEAEPRECYYIFVIEMFATMSKACYECPSNITDCSRPHCIPADGVVKTIYTANRLMPGPTIEVCKNDMIIVDVRNEMQSESTSIHWHGIKQEGTPYMDGTPFVTQCPILPGNSFRYAFNASHSGTYLWHSHSGSQRDDGLFGGLIVHSPPRENSHSELYDYDDKIMTVKDWKNTESNENILKEDHVVVGVLAGPDTFLINGKGRQIQKKTEDMAKVPFAVFEVQENSRYRFRLINGGGFNCPVEVSIDNHTMLVISTDGNDIEPVEVDVLLSWNGERLDFVVKADQEIDNYWIRYRRYGACSPGNNEIRQVAILRYKSAPETEPSSPAYSNLPEITNSTRVFNPINTGTEDPTAISVPTLKSLAENDESITRKPDYQFFITYDFYEIDNHHFHRKNLYGAKQVDHKFVQVSILLNYIAMKLPSFPPLSQPYMIDENTFCNSTTISGKKCEENVCFCTHAFQVKLNSVVELVLIDRGLTLRHEQLVTHPMHLHGHFFRVVAMEALGDRQASAELVKKLDREGKIKRILDRAPIKDTVKIPSNGYTILRFHATNPGYWLYHCHIDRHMAHGQGVIFKVGEHEDLPPVPERFPTCGDF